MKFKHQICLLTFSVLSLMPMALTAAPSQDGPIVGHSEGNHRLDCTIIRPWDEENPPVGFYPVIGWANGWGQGNVLGADQTDHYLDGLDFWAEAGFLVIAANQWSARSPDVLQCLQWLIDANADDTSEYYGRVDTDNIGVSGHSQGGGAALKAGDGIFEDGTTMVSTVVAMNPYGPSFVKSMDQNGQILLLGGTDDGVTPTDSFSKVLENNVLSGEGGLQAELIGGTHCYPACYSDFMEFGLVSRLWFQIFLTDGDKAAQCDALKFLLDENYWNLIISSNFVCLP